MAYFTIHRYHRILSLLGPEFIGKLEREYKLDVAPTKISKMTLKQSHYTSASDRNFEKEKQECFTNSLSISKKQINEVNL